MTRSYSDRMGNDSFGYDRTVRLTRADSGPYGISAGQSFTTLGCGAERAGLLVAGTLTVSGMDAETYVAITSSLTRESMSAHMVSSGVFSGAMPVSPACGVLIPASVIR